VRARKIEFAPTPDGGYGFSVSYRRRLSHLDSTGAVVAGPLREDDDEPIWGTDDAYDGYLIAGAKADGAALNGDPTSALADQVATGVLGALMNEEAGPTGAPVQYARDGL
jgi:hypothetical protein